MPASIIFECINYHLRKQNDFCEHNCVNDVHFEGTVDGPPVSFMPNKKQMTSITLKGRNIIVPNILRLLYSIRHT